MNAIETSAEVTIRRRAKRMSVAQATVAASLLLLAGGAAHCAVEPTAAWGAADDAYATQRYADALHGYEALARDGDAAAAERAGQMLYFGDGLYGRLLPQDLPRAKVWLMQASAAGRESAGFLLIRLEQRAPSAPPAGERGADETPYVIGPYGC